MRSPSTSTPHRVAATAGIGLVAMACACSPDDAPVLSTRAPAPPPFASLPDRRIEGLYTLTAGDWSFDPSAFSDRSLGAFARVTVFAAGSPVTCTRLRITQPAGYGAPFSGRHERFALAELEVYARPDPSRYVHEPGACLVRNASIATDSSADGFPAAALTDGRLVAGDDAPHWRSSDAAGAHWIDVVFPEPTTWNQLVLTWPRADVGGPWPRDPIIAEGLRASAVEIHVRDDEGWRATGVREVGPAGRHDGAFIAELTGLDRAPASRLAHLHPLVAGPPTGGGDISGAAGWRIETPADPPAPIGIAARELAEALASRGRATSDTAARVCRILTLSSLHAGGDSALHEAAIAMGRTSGSHALVVSGDGVVALGADAIGARYAACRFERMLRERPEALRPGAGPHIWRPRAAPRVVGSVAFGEGDELGFSDAYLSAIARGFADGILIFQNGPYMSDVTSVFGSSLDASLTGDPSKAEKLRDLVARAAQQGLETYWMISLPGALPGEIFDRHPEIRGTNPNPHAICLSTAEGERFVRDAVRRVAEEVPQLAGLVVLRSEFSHGCGGRLLCRHCQANAPPGEDPAQRIFEWARETIAATGAETRIIAMDWRAGGLPPVDVEALHEDIAIWTRPGLREDTPENDVRTVAPGPHLAELLAPGSKRDVFVELQVGYVFPLHSVPELAVPHLITESLTRILDASAVRRGAGRTGIVFGNGSGFLPTAMQELALDLLLFESDAPASPASLAARWYGPRADREVLAAWRLFSEAFRTHATFDKYLSRVALFLMPGETPIELSGADRIALDALVAAWGRGVTRLERATALAAPAYRSAVERSTAYARAVLLTLKSLAACTSWTAAFGEETPEEVRAAGSEGDLSRARRILSGELANVRAYVALIADHSELRAHPYYRSLFALPVITDKMRRLEAALTG